MSTVQDSQTVWSVSDNVNSKYEKCLNITEEIYKRINITFQIKKLETATQSDVSDLSDQIDSNELSNETDLFACDKSSISSSEEALKPTPVKYININNNEEKPRPAVVYKRPRKRFRKRVKKRQSKQAAESDGSSDEALPLSRIVDIDIDKCASEGHESADNVMGLPNILILTKDLKSKADQDKKSSKKDYKETVINNDKSVKTDSKKGKEISKTIDKKGKDREITDSPTKEAKTSVELRNCTMCSLSFRGDRGFRRHMTMSHAIFDIKTRHGGEKEKPV